MKFWLLALASTATAVFNNNLKPPPIADEETDFSLTTRDAIRGAATFTQLVDHDDPSQGTFAQRYWWSTEFWKGPGSPVVFLTPGEVEAELYTGYLTNRTITGQFAQAIGGAVILMEHRYWGTSSPFEDLTTKNLRFLTLSNSIHDVTHFARNVSLPFDTSGRTNAPQAPWVMSGGSYAGALTAWTHAKDPGTFWAYHASSAVVEAIDDFWQYFEPVRQGLPSNCSLDIQRVIKHVDEVLATGSRAEIQALKDRFGFGGVEHDDDFAGALENGPWQWQDHDFYSGYSTVYQFCDYVENVVPKAFNRTCTPGPHGVGLSKALDGYAKWTKQVYIPDNCQNTGYFTGEYNLECFDTYNASNPMFTDTSLENAIDRQWNWLLCNEPFLFWQDGAPEGVPTIVSRLIKPEYWSRQCDLFFPEEDGYTYGLKKGKTADDVNEYTGGWSDVDTKRLLWVNGEFDPWKHATVSSDFRPGGPLVSTPSAPVHVIPGGIHCSDLLYANAQANAGVLEIVKEEVATIKGWVDEFYAIHGNGTTTTKRAATWRA